MQPPNQSNGTPQPPDNSSPSYQPYYNQPPQSQYPQPFYQPPDYTQPNTYYPPQQPPGWHPGPAGPPPPPPPRRRSRRGWVIAAIIIAAIIVLGAANESLNGASTPTTDTSRHSTSLQQWTVVQTFKGNGNLKTAIFFAPGDWKIVWTCYPTTLQDTYNMIVDVYNDDATAFDLAAINTICQNGNVTGATEEHQGGNVYLDIHSEGSWTVQMQFLE